MHQPPRERDPYRSQFASADSWFADFWHLDVHLGDMVMGPGLLLLMEIASNPLDSGWMAVAIIVGALASLSLLWLYPWLCGSARRAPVWLCLFSHTANIIITLAVTIALFARLCPSEGRELVLVPIYFLLCMSRLEVCLRWPLPLVGCFLELVLLCGAPSDPSERLGLIDLDGRLDGSEPPAASFSVLALFVIYDHLSQWCRLCEHLFHFPVDDSVRFRPVSDQGCADEAARWLLIRALTFVVLAMARGAWSETFLSLYLSPLPTYSVPYTFHYTFALFALGLLLWSMCAASTWFVCLKAALESLTRRLFPFKRLVRLQHILNALVVCAAWAFPLEHEGLSVTLRGIVAAIVVGAGVLWVWLWSVAWGEDKKKGAC